MYALILIIVVGISGLDPTQVLGNLHGCHLRWATVDGQSTKVRVRLNEIFNHSMHRTAPVGDTPIERNKFYNTPKNVRYAIFFSPNLSDVVMESPDSLFLL